MKNVIFQDTLNKQRWENFFSAEEYSTTLREDNIIEHFCIPIAIPVLRVAVYKLVIVLYTASSNHHLTVFVLSVLLY